MSPGILHHIDISPLDYLPILESKPLRVSCLQTGNKTRENQKENTIQFFTTWLGRIQILNCVMRQRGCGDNFCTDLHLGKKG
jgi:hypothetical protein